MLADGPGPYRNPRSFDNIVSSIVLGIFNVSSSGLLKKREGRITVRGIEIFDL